jgi:hypothetical protein
MSAYDIGNLTFTLVGPGHLGVLAADSAVWCDNGPDGAPLWRLHAVDEGGRRVDLDAGMAAAWEADGTAFTWRDVTDQATGAGPFDVTLTVRPAEGGAAWRIAVANRAAAWTLWSVRLGLPGVRPDADAAANRLVYPEGWGTQAVGWGALPTLDHRYPRGWNFTLQLLAFSRGASTLYFATHDPALTTKDFHFAPHAVHADLAVTLYPEGMSEPGNGYAPDFDLVTAVLPGDWYDAAQLYARWARPQPWAAPRAPHPVAAWQVMMVPDKPLDTWAAEMEALAAHLGVPLGIHYYNWHQVPFDTDYPDYFPAREGVADLVARMRRAGIVCMPYINGRLWDISAPSWAACDAEPHAVKLTAERLFPRTRFTPRETYGSGQYLAPMCPTTAFWQDTVLDLCRRIVDELGCDGVYLDQICAEKAELCMAPNHGHPLGGGGYWLAGYRQLMARVRAAVGEAACLTTECNWEGGIADFDGLLMWHSLEPGLVPLFAAIYAGQARTFGCRWEHDLDTGDGLLFADRMAMLLVWGAQLGWGDLTPLLRDDRRDLLAYFAALCRLRADYAPLFDHGRLLRPPTAAPLRVAAWRGEGHTVLVAVNPTREAVATTVTVDGTAVEVALEGLAATVITLE